MRGATLRLDRMKQPLLLGWSGGKDSALALERLRDDARWHVVGLLTSIDPEQRIAIHGVRRSILHAQARALGLPLYEAALPARPDNSVYAASFAHALTQARRDLPGLDTIAFGDLFLADVRAWREALLARLGWRGVFPLWGENTARLARAFVARGHRAILCCVDTHQLDAAFCARDYDDALLDALPASCDPCGENGEFHTCVHAGPLFAAPIALARGARSLHAERFARVDLVHGPDVNDLQR